MIRTVTLRGPFRDQDLAVLATALRWIDQHNPEAVFEMVVPNPDGTIKEGQSLLAEMLPEMAGRATHGRAVMERFSDAQRQLLVTLVLRHWATACGLDEGAEAELKGIVARMSGTDTVLLASRGYPSAEAELKGIVARMSGTDPSDAA